MGKEKAKKIKIGISIGDVNGIGIEVIIKTFNDNRMLDLCTPVIYGSAKVVSYHRNAINAKSFQFNSIKNAEESKANKVNIVNCREEDVNIELGDMTEEAGEFAFHSLKAAVKDLREEKIQALVTAPINKKNIQSKDFDFPGHTEFLTRESGSKESLMMMVSENLKIGVITGHIPVNEIAGNITREKFIEKVNIMGESLKKDFGIRKPKIAVLGLNPHAGDNGLIGDEDEKIIKPAIKELNTEKQLVMGPYAADGFFGKATYRDFDAIMAMYHDQGLIPFKTLAFEEGVNYTAGLSFIRTSPDHGTAYDIAGKGTASEASFRNAVFEAINIHRTRSGNERLSKNPLPVGIGKKKTEKKD